MGLISSVLIALRLGPINCSHNMKWALMHRSMLCYVIYGLKPALFVPVFKKGLGAPCWVPHWGARATMCATQRHAGGHAACSMRGSPPLKKGMPDIPMALWIFFHLHKYHEPVRPWMVAAQWFFFFFFYHLAIHYKKQLTHWMSLNSSCPSHYSP